MMKQWRNMALISPIFDSEWNLMILPSIVKGHDFVVFDDAEYIGAINAQGCADYSRKDLDKLTDFVKSQQIGAKGLVYVKYNEDGSVKSSVDKFYSENDLREWLSFTGAKPGDLLLILAGERESYTWCSWCTQA